MRQFVRDQALSIFRTRLETSRREGDVTADGERVGRQILRACLRSRIGMYPHPAEIAPKRRLHVDTRRFVERAAGRAQNVLDPCGRLEHAAVPRTDALQPYGLAVLIPAVNARATAVACSRPVGRTPGHRLSRPVVVGKRA
jgi:hypothetical protein